MCNRRTHITWDAQVLVLCNGERGRAGPARLQKLPHGALLRAALPDGGLRGAPSGVRAAAGAPGVGALLNVCV